MIRNNRLQDRLITYGQMNLIVQARNLWRDLVVWSRVYLISRIAGIGITEDVFNRLYRIPLDFGNIIRLIFGNQAADTVIQQLSSTLVLFRDLVEAMLTENDELANQNVQALYVNANERAASFASINPFWDETQWRYLITTFYNYSIQEITSILTSDPRNVDIFDRFLHHADMMGDYFAQGVYNYLIYNTEPTSQVSFHSHTEYPDIYS